jgi:hypothetical protein
VGSVDAHTWGLGNFDGDDDVDLSDYNWLAGNFTPTGYATVVVPEPTTCCLLLAGLLLLAGGRIEIFCNHGANQAG